MTTRVDPAMYSDTPIFQRLLADRLGRWPGIPVNELPPVSLLPALAPLVEAPEPVPAMSLVHPIPPASPGRTRPYVVAPPPEEHDSEATASMPFPYLAEG